MWYEGYANLKPLAPYESPILNQKYVVVDGINLQKGDIVIYIGGPEGRHSVPYDVWGVKRLEDGLRSDKGTVSLALLPSEDLPSNLTWVGGDASVTTNKEPKSIMHTLKERFVLALTKEPQKSFRKAGVTNGDDILTDEGMKVFLSWLLHQKFAEDFKKEVVDDLLAEMESEKKD